MFEGFDRNSEMSRPAQWKMTAGVLVLVATVVVANFVGGWHYGNYPQKRLLELSRASSVLPAL